MSNFHGTDRAQWAVTGVEVCESAYAPHKALAKHDHEHAFWCLTLNGGYTEHVGRRCREASRGHLAWHPPGENHDLSSTAGGLTSGINLALRVLERYYGREQAEHTAEYMEYTGQGWKA